MGKTMEKGPTSAGRMREDVIRETASAITATPSRRPEFMGSIGDRLEGVSSGEFAELWWGVAQDMGATRRPTPDEVLEALRAVVSDGMAGNGKRDVPDMLRALEFGEAYRLSDALGVAFSDLTQWVAGDGARYAAARNDAGMTELDAADALGVTATKLRDWEHGASIPDAYQLRAMAELYRRSADELLGLV